MRHFLPCAAGAFILAMGLSAQVPPPWIQVPPPAEPDYPAITASPAEVAHGGWVPVDARDLERLRGGHLPGAVHLPAQKCGTAESGCLHTALGEAGITGDTPLVVYGETLVEAAQAFLLLEAAGCRDVRVLDGGVAAWRAAGLPLETGELRPRPARPFSGATKRDVTLTADELLRQLTDPFFAVLDVRDRGDWTQNGYEAPPAYRAGHIPHSLPWDPEILLPGGGRLPDPRSARSRFLLLGVRASARIPPRATPAVYGEGTGDPRAALAYLLLRGMGFSPRVLSEGFAGWQSAGRPVSRIVEADEVRRLLAGGRAVVIDLRELSDYAAEHIPGAVAIPVRHFGEEVAAAVRGARPSFNPSTDPLVLYCYGRDCLRSHDAAAIAAQAGVRQILWFRDGMDAWRAAGLPVEARQARAQGPTL